MSFRRSLRSLRPLLAAATVIGLAACATDGAEQTARPKTPAAAAAPVPADLDGAALCTQRAVVEDALARGDIAGARQRLEQKKDRASRFAALLLITNEAERFKAFADDELENKTSPLGPTGECFVYAQWKMPEQAATACARAERVLGAKAQGIVEVARAELSRRMGALDEAQQHLDAAAAQNESCAAAWIERAQLQVALWQAGRAQYPAIVAAWDAAFQAWPSCYLCAVEAARRVEANEGLAAASGRWEKAQLLAPAAPEALKRFGASLAGVDDARALKLYETAIGAGVHDNPTLLAAAELARRLNAADKARGYAERAATQQKNDVDAWRAVLALSVARPSIGDADADKGVAPAREVVRLKPDDALANLVLARDAKKRGDLVAAITGYDVAAAALAVTPAPAPADGLLAEEAEALKREHQALLTQLRVAPKAATGKPADVVNTVQENVQELFAERVRQKKALKGQLDVAVTTLESGGVATVEIEKDTLGDPVVAASVVANLRRATIVGGSAKRYAFTLEFR